MKIVSYSVHAGSQFCCKRSLVLFITYSVTDHKGFSFDYIYVHREAMQVFRLRENYCQVLERDRERCVRNDTILQTLTRIENRTTALTAKTDRLRVLRVSSNVCLYVLNLNVD